MAILSDLRVGERAVVVSFAKGEKAYRRKLLSLGLTPKTTFQVTRVAPLGDPVEIRVRGFSLSLRRAEAGILCVERVSS